MSEVGSPIDAFQAPESNPLFPQCLVGGKIILLYKFTYLGVEKTSFFSTQLSTRPIKGYPSLEVVR